MGLTPSQKPHETVKMKVKKVNCYRQKKKPPPSLHLVAKPPPHLTEMALSTLRQNALPAERPADGLSTKGSKRSVATANDGNSSDEDDGNGGTSGYGNAFRARQRARMAQNGTTHLN